MSVLGAESARTAPARRRLSRALRVATRAALLLAIAVGATQLPARADAQATSAPAVPIAPAVPAAPAATSTAAAPAAVTPQTAAPYFVAIQEGLARLREGDAHAAQIAFQRALAADRTRSDGHYLLGVAMRRNESYPAAISSFQEALAKAQLASDLAAEGRARIAIAETLAHVHGRHHEDPQRAWQELLVFAEANPSVVAPEIPRAHIQATTHVAELAAAMGPVRDRIRAREHEARTAPAHGRGSHH